MALSSKRKVTKGALEEWLEFVPDLCKVLHALPVIKKDYPQWLMATTCNGFSSHLIPEAMPTFNEHNILLVQ
jgi:hypothetical protein